MYYSFYSDNLATAQAQAGQIPQNYEAMIELGYRYQVTHYFYVQPNLQGIINPGGRGNIASALVIGAQVEVDF